MTPRVSFVLPVRDAAPTLATALRSVARQTFSDFECLVVDDGSRDDSRALAERFAARDPRFRLLAGRARGIVPALNAGLAAARAPLVARMDADDVAHRERLGLQVEALEREADLAAVGSHVRLFPRNALGGGMRAYERWLNAIDGPEAVRRDAFVECPVAHPTLLLRREALPAGGYRERGWAEDYDLILRLLAGGREVGVVPRRLLAWRQGERRLSRVDARYADHAFTACKAAFLADGFLRHHAHYVLWGYGGTGRALRRALAARGHEPSHVIELHPGRLGNRIHGAPVIPPERLREVAGNGPVVVSVAGAGPRGEIRRALGEMGLTESRDFVCAA